MPQTPHPQLAHIAAMLRSQSRAAAAPERQSVDEARAAQRHFHAAWNQSLPDVAASLELRIPAPWGGLSLRLIRPQPGRTPLPTVVYFHGGGFVLNGPDTHERLMRLLALRSGCAVLGVAYRLAPETRFPHQIDDALHAIAWVRDQGRVLGLDGGNLAVAGDSAGANLALAAQLALRERGLPPVQFGLLLYGMFSARLDTPSHRAFGGPHSGLPSDRVDWFWRQYLTDIAQRDNPLAAPLLADLRGLPPHHLIGAGMDCLLDDTLDMARRMRERMVAVSLSVTPGVPHSFMQMSPYLEPADQAVSQAADAVRQALAPGQESRRPGLGASQASFGWKGHRHGGALSDGAVDGQAAAMQPHQVAAQG